MAFDIDKRMREAGFDVLDSTVPGDASKVKIIKRHLSRQGWFCEWLCNGCCRLEHNGYFAFEEVFHVFPAGKPEEIVARICEEARKGNVKLERKTRKCFRERFGMDI